MAKKRRTSASQLTPVKRTRASTGGRSSTRTTSQNVKARDWQPRFAYDVGATTTNRRNNRVPSPSPAKSSRNVTTRSMTLNRRTKFPFMRLPAELRNMVYELVLNFDGVVQILNEHYEAHVNDGDMLPWPKHRTPSILLVSKQVHREAKFILHRKTLHLPHSTTPNGQITDVVSKNILVNLRKVNITRDLSYGELHTWCDLLEFFTLIKSAVRIWSDAHHLQELTIDMQGKQVVNHLQTCPSLGHCYFMDEIEKLMSSLETLRGIKNVNFGGFLVEYAGEAKKWMQTPPVYLLKKLPVELRQRIYDYVLDWNDANAALVKASDAAVAGWEYKKAIRSWPLDAIAPLTTTPSVLLLNKQIMEEAISALRDHRLTISAPPPRHAHTHTRITKFIAQGTLQEVRHLTLDISSRGSTDVASDWRMLIRELTDILKLKHNLKTLHIDIRDAAWAEAQLRVDSRPMTRDGSEKRDKDFYDLKALGDLVTKRMCETWLQKLTFGKGVDAEVKKYLETQLQGGKMKRWSEVDDMQGLVADD